MTPKNNSRKRIFDNQKTEAKVYALKSWKEGKKISEIARELNKTRSTIYNWLAKADQKLSKDSSRRRLHIDTQTKNRIIELYVLMKKPSIEKLRKALVYYFHIQLSTHQLRRYLSKWGMADYEPSALFDTFKNSSIELLAAADSAYDETRQKESSPKSPEGFSPPFLSDLPSELEGFVE